MIAALLLWNYYLCMMTDPGRVPVAWASGPTLLCLSPLTTLLQKPDTTSGEGHEVKKQTGAPRYCRICEGYKPPRAHHCRQCGRYVLLIPGVRILLKAHDFQLYTTNGYVSLCTSTALPRLVSQITTAHG